MTRTQLLRRAKHRLAALSEGRLRFADSFLAYLEEEDATDELLAIPGFAEEFEEAEADIKAGRLIPVEKLCRKY
jgi:hypothetical protein